MGLQFTTQEQLDLTLPEDSIHVAKLVDLKTRDVPYKDKNDGSDKTFTKLEWWWEITATAIGDQYIGRKVKGECPAELTSHPSNRFRNWAETLLGREIPVGMQLDTEDLLGLSAEVSIGHRPDRKDPAKIWEYVDEVLPLSGGFDLNDEPPF